MRSGIREHSHNGTFGTSLPGPLRDRGRCEAGVNRFLLWHRSWREPVPAVATDRPPRWNTRARARLSIGGRRCAAARSRPDQPPGASQADHDLCPHPPPCQVRSPVPLLHHQAHRHRHVRLPAGACRPRGDVAPGAGTAHRATRPAGEPLPDDSQCHQEGGQRDRRRARRASPTSTGCGPAFARTPWSGPRSPARCTRHPRVRSGGRCGSVTGSCASGRAPRPRAARARSPGAGQAHPRCGGQALSRHPAPVEERISAHRER